MEVILMMKKRIVMAVLLLSLVGCKTVDKPAENSATPNTGETLPKENLNHSEDTSETKEDSMYSDHKTDTMSYIRSVFTEYGYDAPDESIWQIKDEGPKKVAVIIKQLVPNSRPKITKLIFLEGTHNEILFLQIDNKIIIK